MAILIIEDEYLVAADIRHHLQLGHLGEIHYAATETEALEAVVAHHWNAVVVDANLNGSGIDRITRALLERKIPFLIITGYGSEWLPEALRDVPIMKKPFDPQRLVDAVRTLCAKDDAHSPEP